MQIVFFGAAAIAVISTVLVVTRLNAIHALLYMVLSLLSVALVFFSLGAPFIAALEVIVYAGAIMVLFVFVVMMLNIGQEAGEQERAWLSPGTWRGPALLALILLAQVIYILLRGGGGPVPQTQIDPKQVGLALFGPYLLGVELASFLLMAGLVGAFHLGRREPRQEQEG
jgi:NADH-quinone oxidoreductase subunit J